jgi:hypothetical protein
VKKRENKRDEGKKSGNKTGNWEKKKARSAQRSGTAG